MTTKPSFGLLVLPGWDDDGRQQFDALKAALEPRGWRCKRANLPDNTWSAEQRKATTREDALVQALSDYHLLHTEVQGGPIAVLGFSFGAYIGAYVAAARPTQLLVLRSPALYPDEDWLTPKDDLDKRDLQEYRQAAQSPASNAALNCCALFEGDVLLVDSEEDQVIPKPVIASYENAFVRTRSLRRYSLHGADHQLTDPAWQSEYRYVALNWLEVHANLASTASPSDT